VREICDEEYSTQNKSAPTVVCLNATAELNPKLRFDYRNGTCLPISDASSGEETVVKRPWLEIERSMIF
jgi:hypothetical protein